VPYSDEVVIPGDGGRKRRRVPFLSKRDETWGRIAKSEVYIRYPDSSQGWGTPAKFAFEGEWRNAIIICYISTSVSTV